MRRTLILALTLALIASCTPPPLPPMPMPPVPEEDEPAAAPTTTAARSEFDPDDFDATFRWAAALAERVARAGGDAGARHREMTDAFNGHIGETVRWPFVVRDMGDGRVRLECVRNGWLLAERGTSGPFFWLDACLFAAAERGLAPDVESPREPDHVLNVGDGIDAGMAARARVGDTIAIEGTILGFWDTSRTPGGAPTRVYVWLKDSRAVELRPARKR